MQCAGAILGSLLLWGTSDLRSGGLGANSVSGGFGVGNAVLGEAVMTFFLVRAGCFESTLALLGVWSVLQCAAMS